MFVVAEVNQRKKIPIKSENNTIMRSLEKDHECCDQTVQGDRFKSWSKKVVRYSANLGSNNVHGEAPRVADSMSDNITLRTINEYYYQARYPTNQKPK